MDWCFRPMPSDMEAASVLSVVVNAVMNILALELEHTCTFTTIGQQTFDFNGALSHYWQQTVRLWVSTCPCFVLYTVYKRDQINDVHFELSRFSTWELYCTKLVCNYTITVLPACHWTCPVWGVYYTQVSRPSFYNNLRTECEVSSLTRSKDKKYPKI